jgi:hypothetical protein
MRVIRTIAASLIGILLIQSAGLAQTATDQDIRTISQEQAVAVLLANLQVGAEVRIDLAGGDSVEGRLVEKSNEQLVVLHGRQRQVVAAADVVGARLPMRAETASGKAFGIGTGIGFGTFFGWFLLLLSSYR